jgi:hypothetical protein
MIDATGEWIADDPANPPQRSDHHPPPAALVALWAADLAATQYVVFSGAHPFRVPLTASLRAELGANFHLVQATGIPVYRRDAP